MSSPFAVLLLFFSVQMEKTILIKNGTLLLMDENDSVREGDLLIRGSRIESIGVEVNSADTVIDATGCAVLPGFVQTHVHLCQTLFRGAADDLALIDWLKQRVWPMEAAHTRRLCESLCAARHQPR